MTAASEITLDMLQASIARLRERGVIGRLVVCCAPEHAVRIRELNALHHLKLNVKVSAAAATDELALSGLKPKAQPMARPAARRAQPYWRQLERKHRR